MKKAKTSFSYHLPYPYPLTSTGQSDQIEPYNKTKSYIFIGFVAINEVYVLPFQTTDHLGSHQCMS